MVSKSFSPLQSQMSQCEDVPIENLPLYLKELNIYSLLIALTYVRD